MQAVATIQSSNGNNTNVSAQNALHILSRPKQTPINDQKAVLPVALILIECCSVKRTIANGNNAIRDRDARKATAAFKHRISKARHRIRNRDPFKASAVVESRPANARHAIRDRDGHKASTIVESTLSNTHHTIRNRNALKATATVESKGINARPSLRQDHVTHTIHSVDLIGLAIDVLGERDGIRIAKIFDQAVAVILLDEAEAICRVHVFPGQGAVPIRFVPILIHDQVSIIRKRSIRLRTDRERKITIVIDDSKGKAIGKRSVGNVRHLCSKGNAGKRLTAPKCIIFNACNAIRNCNAQKASTPLKCSIANTRHAVRNRDAREPPAGVKHRRINPCQPVRKPNA